VAAIDVQYIHRVDATLESNVRFTVYLLLEAEAHHKSSIASSRLISTRLGPDLQNILRLSYDSAIITIGEFVASHCNQWGLRCVVVRERRALPKLLWGGLVLYNLSHNESTTNQQQIEPTESEPKPS